MIKASARYICTLPALVYMQTEKGIASQFKKLFLKLDVPWSHKPYKPGFGASAASCVFVSVIESFSMSPSTPFTCNQLDVKNARQIHIEPVKP